MTYKKNQKQQFEQRASKLSLQYQALYTDTNRSDRFNSSHKEKDFELPLRLRHLSIKVILKHNITSL